MKNTSGQIIKKRREELKLTQSQLAKALGCSQPNVLKMENGSTPDIRIGLMLERVLGINLAQTFIDIGDDLLLPQNTTGTALAQEQVQYPREIQEVIDLMMGTDNRGRQKIRIAAEDALLEYQALLRKTQLEKTPSVTDIMAMKELLQSDSIFSEKEKK